MKNHLRCERPSKGEGVGVEKTHANVSFKRDLPPSKQSASVKSDTFYNLNCYLDFKTSLNQTCIYRALQTIRGHPVLNLLSVRGHPVLSGALQSIS